MGDNLCVALGVLVKDLTRRALFRGTCTAVVGGAALAVTAAVGLPALPKAQRLIPFKFNTYQQYSIPHSEWRKLYSHPALRLLSGPELDKQYIKIKDNALVKVLNELWEKE